MKMNRIMKVLSLGFLVVQLAGCGSDTESQSSVQTDPPPPVAPPAPNPPTPPDPVPDPPTPPDPVPEPPAPEPMPLEGEVVGVNTGLSQNQITLEAQVTGNGPFTYEWEQSAGPAASIEGEGEQTITVTLPSVEASQDLAFSVTVVDALADSRTFEHAVAVQPTIAGAASIMVDAESVSHSFYHDMNNDAVLDVVQLIDNRHIVVHYIDGESVETVDIIRNMPTEVTSIHLWDADKDNDADFFMLDTNGHLAVLIQTETGFEYSLGGDSNRVNSELAGCVNGEFIATEVSLTSTGQSGVFVRCFVKEDESSSSVAKHYLFMQSEQGVSRVPFNAERANDSHAQIRDVGFWVDMNEDGNTDFVPANNGIFAEDPAESKEITVYFGNGAGQFISQKVNFSSIDVTGWVLIKQITDLNRDGIVDFVVEVSDRDLDLNWVNVFVKLGQEDGTYRDIAVVQRDFFNWRTNVIHDFNHDGFADISGCNYLSCSIYLGGETEYQESFILHFEPSFRSGRISVVSIDEDEQSDDTRVYYVTDENMYVAPIDSTVSGVPARRLRADNQVPLYNRQPEFIGCGFFGQSGACYDEASLRLITKSDTGWGSLVLGPREYRNQEELLVTDLDGDAQSDLIYYNLERNTEYPNVPVNNRAFLSTSNYEQTSTSSIDRGQNRFVFFNADDDPEKELFEAASRPDPNPVYLYDDFVFNRGVTGFDLYQHNGSEEVPVEFGGKLAAMKYEGDLVIFMLHRAGREDLQLRMFRHDSEGNTDRLLQQQHIDVAVTEPELSFTGKHSSVPVMEILDLEGDGDPELIYHYSYENSQTVIAFSLIDGRLGEQRNLWSGECSSLRFEVRLVDIDLDGDLDLVSACSSTQVFIQVSDAQFQLFQTLDKSVVDITDIDGDADPDFIYVNKDLGYFENMIQ